MRLPHSEHPAQLDSSADPDRNVIELSLGDGLPGSLGWYGRHTGPHAAEVFRLFGTNTIATPYTAQASPETVRRAIAALNPGVDVVLVGNRKAL
jgi:hypothetical protein